MTRFEYLEKLDRLLSTLPYSERRDIMYDYEEHFKEGLKEGTAEEEIIKALGEPEKVAGQYVTAIVPVTREVSNEKPQVSTSTIKPTPKQPIKKKGNSIGEIIALAIIMLLFNSIFIGFYLGFWGLLIGFVAVGIALLVAGFAVLVSSIITAPVAFISAPAILFQYPILGFGASIALISLGGLLLIGLFYIIKFTCILTAKYVKWLIKLIRGF